MSAEKRCQYEAHLLNISALSLYAINRARDKRHSCLTPKLVLILKSMVLCIVILCSMIDVHQHFEEYVCHHHQRETVSHAKTSNKQATGAVNHSKKQGLK